MLVLGIDVGGTKATAWLADEHGQVLSAMRGPGATLQAGGAVAVEHALTQVIHPALRAAASRITAICAGMAGVDRPEDAAEVRAILERLSRTTTVLVVNDALVALEAGIGDSPGIVIVAGTGSIAYGRDERGRAARAGGWGYVLGDEGSGYWLGRQALFAVVRAEDGRGPATSLTARVLAHFGITRAQELVREVYYRLSHPSAIAALAGLIQPAADDGDAVTLDIIDRAATELSAAATAVASRLSLTDCPILLSGGVFQSTPRLAAGVTARLRDALPRAEAHALRVEPVTGAVRLAIAVAQGRAVVPEYVGVD